MIDYLSAVEELRQIEQRYDVMSIKYRDVSVWPVLRVYIVNKLFKDKQPQEVSSNYKLVLKTLFKYNPLSFFKKHDVWVFCATGSRKKIGNMYVQQVCGSLTELGVNTLMIEKADRIIGHYRKREIPEKDVLSLSWFYLFSFGYERLMRIKNINIDNEDIIKQILDDYKISFNYKFYIRLLVAQEKIASLMLKLTYKPQLMLIQAPYVYMGIVWAFHKRNIPVVELQHGVLNDHHYGYNPLYRYDLLMPDRICVFGEREYAFFMSSISHFCKNITKTGLYILEKADDYFCHDIFSDYRTKYTKIVVSAGEEGREQRLLSFIDRIAAQHPDYMFIHIPRIKTTILEKKCNNVEIVRGVNIYEYLKWCDIHMTIASTTCLEAHYFKKPTVFYNYEKLSFTYYGDVLSIENAAYYIDKDSEFTEVLRELNNRLYTFKELFAHHPKDNLQKVILDYVKQ